MKKLMLTIIAVVLALSFVLTTVSASASTLREVKFSNMNNSGSGFVNIRDSITQSGKHITNLLVGVKGLLPEQGRTYEAWLVGNSTQLISENHTVFYENGTNQSVIITRVITSVFYNSLGKFKTSRLGNGALNARLENMNFNPYYGVLISSEPSIDIDPSVNKSLMFASISK